MRFHSIGIPSEWGRTFLALSAFSAIPVGFHSIGIPSEWGQWSKVMFVSEMKGFHSIGIPSEWGQSVSCWIFVCVVDGNFCFHSIGIPSEWGHFQGW